MAINDAVPKPTQWGVKKDSSLHDIIDENKLTHSFKTKKNAIQLEKKRLAFMRPPMGPVAMKNSGSLM